MGSNPRTGTALFGATRQAVLQLLFNNAYRRFFQRQIIRRLELGSGAVQRELEQLVAAGILTRTLEGRQTYFQANPECPIFEELRGIVRKTFGLADVLREALAPLASGIRLAFLFGSVAAGNETAASDVDVMLVTDGLSFDEIVAALSQAQKQLGREVNPVVYRSEEFCRKLAQGHAFIQRVVAGQKVFLIGGENELAGLAAVRVAQRTPGHSTGNRRSVRRS